MCLLERTVNLNLPDSCTVLQETAQKPVGKQWTNETIKSFIHCDVILTR
jgi:hypothetical protein